MSNPPEDQSDTNAHEKNRAGLEITKKTLQKELDSIIGLIGLDSKKESSFSDSSSFQSQPNISQNNYNSLLEANRKLQSDVKTLSTSLDNLKFEINTLRENIRILQAEQTDGTLFENQLKDLWDVVNNLKLNNVSPGEDITEEIPEEIYYSEETVSQVSNVQDELKSPVEETVVEKETVLEETRRRRCPTCNNGNQRYIRELVDKTNVINYSPRIFGKKYKCGICTTEWK